MFFPDRLFYGRIAHRDLVIIESIFMIQKVDLFKKLPHGEPGLSKFLKNPYAFYKESSGKILIKTVFFRIMRKTWNFDNDFFRR